ncbi:MAG: hypothetical protein P1U40_04830 [Coxiellaceae bacterium]|nr:hypothetical protein [Coxiellaceae bacterium]
MPKTADFNSDMIGRAWRQLIPAATLTAGSYLMAVSACLTFCAFKSGRVSDVLTVPGFLRVVLFASALKGGYELLRVAPKMHQNYFNQWLPDRVVKLSRTDFDAELKQEQVTYKVLTATAFVSLVAVQQYYLPLLLSGKEQFSHVTSAALTTLVTCLAVAKKQHDMLGAVTAVEDAGTPTAKKLA